MADEYDVIIIGGGAAGENVAGRTGPAGLSTVLVESELVGGECSYWACMPSKALLRPAQVLTAARRVPAASEAVTGRVSVERTLRSRDAFAGNWDDAREAKWLASVNSDLVRGYARLAGPKRVEVETEGGRRMLTARRAVVVAAGSRPVIPSIPGMDGVRPWTSREATSAKAVPQSLVVMGGGPVGLEMAQAWHSLGSEVTLIDRNRPEDNPRLEPFALEVLFEVFEQMGIRVLLGASLETVQRADGRVIATIEGGETITASELLVATGREPTTEDLGLETIGLEPGRPMEVDDHLRVKDVEGGWLYAVGDVNGRALLTHQGKYQARIAGDNIAGKNVSAWADEVAVPGVIFTDPQVGSVGLTERLAREQGLNVRAVHLDWVVAAASLVGRGTVGGAKFIVDEDRSVLVGVTFVGPEAGELLHAATIAIAGQVPLERLWHAVPSFPTLSEIWLRFLEEYGL